MTDSQTFSPDWVSAPGDTIRDSLRSRGWSTDDFATRAGLTIEEAIDLLDGRLAVTIAIARKLKDTVGASVEFWMARDRDYRLDSARLQAVDDAWLAELPLRDMVSFGWLNPRPRATEELRACLDYFGVPSLRAWRQRYGALAAQVAFRKSASFDSRPAAVAAWLRQGELQAEQLRCNPWNADGFRESLAEIRSLTRLKDPKVFLPKLRSACAANGVAVVVVRAPTGCRASGATWFVAQDKAILMLSFRHLSDDHFWFSFCHEAAHLLLHGLYGLLIEGINEKPDAVENEANAFAEALLVPPEFGPKLAKVGADAKQIIRLAGDLGISPGILVGQLQHRGSLAHGKMNYLKRRFVWEEA